MSSTADTAPESPFDEIEHIVQIIERSHSTCGSQLRQLVAQIKREHEDHAADAERWLNESVQLREELASTKAERDELVAKIEQIVAEGTGHDR